MHCVVVGYPFLFVFNCVCDGDGDEGLESNSANALLSMSVAWELPIMLEKYLNIWFFSFFSSKFTVDVVQTLQSS